MVLDLSKEKQMRIESAMIGVELAFNKLGIQRDEISQREAFRLFGESRVRNWVNQKTISPIKKGKDNSRVVYSRIELEVLKSIEDIQNKINHPTI